MAQKAAKKKVERKRFTDEEKAKILDAAKKEKLTAAQVEKRFGVSAQNFYRWRGPKTRKAARNSFPARSKPSRKRGRAAQRLREIGQQFFDAADDIDKADVLFADLLKHGLN